MGDLIERKIDDKLDKSLAALKKELQEEFQAKLAGQPAEMDVDAQETDRMAREVESAKATAATEELRKLCAGIGDRLIKVESGQGAAKVRAVGRPSSPGPSVASFASAATVAPADLKSTAVLHGFPTPITKPAIEAWTKTWPGTVLLRCSAKDLEVKCRLGARFVEKSVP